MLAKYNKQTRNADGILRNFDFKWDTAYHLDAQLLGQYLKDNIAIPNGVKHVIGDVHSYNTHNPQFPGKGSIKEILLVDGTKLFSDLWIDCTGFKSLLLEEWMGSTFLPFDKQLANDSAWACRLPYIDREREMHNVTDCHALGNGWVWNIPLWNRIGTGYVYSSRFTSADEAQQEFRDHIAEKHSPELAEKAEMFHINIRHGRRRKAWVENVVGVGLSYGFVEPLESTGLLTTHENIIKLVDTLNRRNGFVTRSEVEGYNLAVDSEVCRFRDFVSMHYAYSKRTDTPYWRYCTEINDYCPDMFNDFMLHQAQYPNMLGNLIGNQRYYEDYVGNNFIAAGMGMKSIATKELIFCNGDRLEDLQREEEIGYTKRRYEEYRDFIIDHVSKLPSHYEFLRDEIYGGVDEHL